MGTLSQMCAGLSHYVSPARLSEISLSIPKVVLITGDVDHLIHPQNTLFIKQHMPEAELIQWEDTGHGLHYQRKKMFNALVERAIEEGRERAGEMRTKST